MAPPSPNVSNSNSDGTPAVTILTPTPPLHQQRSDTPKTQRGQNKPKCASCGNVARSKCPFHSCKSCCSRARNPCAIHEKTPTPSSTLVEKSPEIPLAGTSVKQLSSNFNQFNNVQVIRSRRAPTRKEAAAVNQWRYSKLKEYNEQNIETGDEAFDRYIHNVRLLEEIFNIKSGCFDPGVIPEPAPEKETGDLRSENTANGDVKEGGAEEKKRMCIVESNKMRELRSERYLALKEVNEKLSRVRSEDELSCCKKMRSDIFLRCEEEACSISGKKKQLLRREMEQKTLDELEKCSTSPGLMEIQAL